MPCPVQDDAVGGKGAFALKNRVLQGKVRPSCRSFTVEPSCLVVGELVFFTCFSFPFFGHMEEMVTEISIR